MIKSIRPFLGTVSKAKASKIVRELVDTFLDMESSTGVEIPLCLECIDWAKRWEHELFSLPIARFQNRFNDLAVIQCNQ